MTRPPHGWLRRLLAPLRRTPFHPQWHVFRHEERKLATLAPLMSGTVVDIGCADQKPRKRSAPGCRYIGLDYYQTATDWYHSRPDVYGDAQRLPFVSESAHCVLLLDVLEHLPDPDRCMAEVHRVLRASGRLVIEVPFLYPIHDAPLDFHRWTPYGLARLAERHGFRIESLQAFGSPAENAALLVNLAFAREMARWIQEKSPMIVFSVLAPILVLLSNFAGVVFASRSCEGDFMSLGYRVVMTKAT
ncbi:MAG: class I SAM-dependent methyltransferase [Gammaproteobacteria bacterium]|nr:class I SAM-dependent methyltransferase [Gammaproteobacteria bacterium]